LFANQNLHVFTKEFIFTNLKYSRSPYLIGNNGLKIGEIEKAERIKKCNSFCQKSLTYPKKTFYSKIGLDV